MKARTQDDYIRTALRVPPELHARLHEAAKDSGRTFNAEILARLEGSFDAAAMTKVAADMLIKSQLLNFELAAQLSRHDIKKLTLAYALMTKLFTDEGTIRDRVFALAESGDPIAAKAMKTVTEDMIGIVQDVQSKAELLLNDEPGSAEDGDDYKEPELAKPHSSQPRKKPKASKP